MSWDFRKILSEKRNFAPEISAGFNSHSNLRSLRSVSRVLIKGEKNLTSESAKRIANAFNLKKREIDFFLYLVDFTQAKTSKKKDEVYQQMLGRPLNGS